MIERKKKESEKECERKTLIHKLGEEGREADQARYLKQREMLKYKYRERMDEREGSAKDTEEDYSEKKPRLKRP